LKVLVVAMGVLLLGGTVTLVVLLVQRAGVAARVADIPLGQPADARIAGIAQGADGLLAVWVARADGDRVVLVDTKRGAAAGEVRLR